MMKLAEIFQDHMMLQCNKPVRVWGTAPAGISVSASIQDLRGEAVTDSDGNWMITLPALSPSAEETLTVTAGEETTVLTDVAVGEIWIAAGQSNMEFWMRYEKHFSQEQPVCANADLRFYDVPEVSFPEQRTCFDFSLVARWRKATPEDLDYFSAVGYYFQKDLMKNLSVPAGIVGCNWGGTRSAAWMSAETARRVGQPWVKFYHDSLDRMEMSIEEFRELQKTLGDNDTGNAIDNPFNAFMLPKTRSGEELGAFFSQLPADDAYMLLPHVNDEEGVLYEHMVKPLAPFTVRGVLWYQGESDDAIPEGPVLYEDMLTALIGDWRGLWGEELPFLVVQLPGFRQWLQISCVGYAGIRQSQQKVADTVPGVYLCSISDSGEEFDIHPKDKEVVGKRLALLAEGHVYGQDVLCDPPRPTGEMIVSGNEIRISFANAGNGLCLTRFSDSTTPDCSELTVTEDGSVIPVTASTSGSLLILTSDQPLKGSIEVSYAKDVWYLAGLKNSAGLPAVPFSLKK